MNLLENIIYKLGQYGPFVLSVYSIFLLRNHEVLLFYYVIGFFLNSILNIVLKGIIQQPRPSENPKVFEAAMKNGKRFMFKDGVPHDMFGMPSGHSQSSLFSSIFVFLSIRKYNQLFIYLLFSLLVMYQRVKYNFHTLNQVIVGAIVGILFGYLVFSLSQEKIKGPINEKPDEDAPL